MITGGTSGIGYAIASRFLQEGAERIILVGRSYERLVKAASNLNNKSISQPNQPYNDNIAQTQEPPASSPQGTLLHFSDRIHLLVGDVSDAGSWLRELEKAMVRNTRSYIPTKTKKSKKN
jgi:NAD(P)-dependent dehydrogenase (short-subunit alcohol dehydrogenase family)